MTDTIKNHPHVCAFPLALPYKTVGWKYCSLHEWRSRNLCNTEHNHSWQLQYYCTETSDFHYNFILYIHNEGGLYMNVLHMLIFKFLHRRRCNYFAVHFFNLLYPC